MLPYLFKGNTKFYEMKKLLALLHPCLHFLFLACCGTQKQYILSVPYLDIVL